MMAIVAEGPRGRIYLPPNEEHEKIAASAAHFVPPDVPDTDLPEQALGFRVQLYGMTKHRDLFTPRQLVALTTFSDLVGETRERVRQDAVASGIPDDDIPLEELGVGATAYADAVATYLGIVASKTTVFHNVLARWRPGDNKSAPAFGRQALPMVWDFTEVNPFAGAGGDFSGVVDGTTKVLRSLSAKPIGSVAQLDATATVVDVRLVPKAQELVATPYRFGGDRKRARSFFEDGLGEC